MGLGYARSLLSKCLIQDNQKKPSRANVYFCQDLFPLKKKKKSQKRSKRSQEESQVQSRAILEPWSLESCQASWQEVRRACDGNLPCVSSEVHSNRDTSAQHFAYNKSALSDKNLGWRKPPSPCSWWHNRSLHNKKGKKKEKKETGCVIANVNGLHYI